MLYYLFDFLEQRFNLPGAGLFQYISFRAGMAIMLSLVISMLFGNRIIGFLKSLQIGERVRDLGLEGEREKEGTPTMGGIIILMGILIPCLLLAKLDNIYIVLLLIATSWMAIIGFVDDYIKVFLKNKKGLSGKFKVIGQVGLGLIVGITMLVNEEIVVRVDLQEAIDNDYLITKTIESTDQQGSTIEMAYVKTTITNVPFIKGNVFDYADIVGIAVDNPRKWVWILFLPLVIFVVTAVSNAANLTDGIDGLASGTSAIIGAVLGLFAYVSGNTLIADYLSILYIPDAGEMLVFAACFVGTCIGFLWYNAYPAKVFMGDTGSLTLGGIIAAMALLLRKELLIPVLCGIFLIENLSVVLQVGYFKYTKKKYGEGRRIFKMAPLHHHYQKLGMHEAKIATRFWIVGVLLAVFSIITLKTR